MSKIFILVLTMDKENIKERIRNRTAGNEKDVKVLTELGDQIFQPVENNEQRVVTVEIHKSMTKENVVDEILSRLSTVD